MQVLVTGGAGFIGSAIARGLIAAGHTVVALDNLESGRRSSIPPEAKLVEGDITDLETCRHAIEGCEVAFHQAALPSVARSIEDPAKTNETNVTGTLNLLMAARGSGCRRVVYASSSSVYGEAGAGAKTESQPPSPRSPYAVSKLTGEMYALAFSASLGLPSVALRYFNVFGPGQSAESEYAAVIPRFAMALLKGEPPEVHGDGKQTRDFTYIDDVVKANLLAMDREEAVGKSINVATGRARSVLEALATISDAVGTWIEPKMTEPRPGDIRDSLADLTLAKEALGYVPQADWDEAIQSTVEWFRS